MSAFVTVLRVLLIVVQAIMTLSLVPDIYKVHKNKSTGEMIVYPLVSIAGANYVWALYGYLSNNLATVFSLSVLATVAGTIYTAVYFRWTTNRMYVLKPCAVAVVGAVLVTAYMVQGLAGVAGQTKAQVTDVLGYLGDALSIGMFASPLESAWHVIQTKSSASVPINYCVMMFAATGLWVAVAIADDDLFVLVPNALGVAFSVTQITLYFMYRPRTHQDVVAPVNGEVKIVISPKASGYLSADKSPPYQAAQSPLAPPTTSLPSPRMATCVA